MHIDLPMTNPYPSVPNLVQPIPSTPLTTYTIPSTTFVSPKWRTVWLDNYNGVSDAAKDIELLIKKNYKGHNYISWAVLQKWLYLMDENAEVSVLDNPLTNNIVHQHTTTVHKVQNNDTITNTLNAFYIRVQCVFLGKVFTDVYPIQDNSYNAPNFVDSNMINKAVQRAKARVISIATGLGLRLYETGDLQYEDDSAPSKKETIKPTVKTTVKAKEVKETPKIDEKVKTPDVVKENELDYTLANYIMEHKDTILTTLQAINKSMVKNYKVSLNLTDSLDELAEKINLVSNVNVFTNSVIRRHKDSLTK